MTVRRFIITAVLVIPFALLPALGFGQDPDLEDKYEEALKKFEDEMDERSQVRAEEYLDVLERLAEVLEEYSVYMEDLAAETAIKGELTTNGMQDALNRGSYTDNPEKLLDDIYQLIDEIKAVENQLRVKYGSNEPKGSRVVRSFRRELLVIAELVEDYSDQQSTQFLKQKVTKQYLDEALKAALAALQNIERLKDDLDEVPEVPPLPELPGFEEALEPPTSPTPPPDGDYDQWSVSRGKKGRVQKYSAILTEIDRKLPVHIESSFGDVEIVGWDQNNVGAFLSVEVSAQSGERESDFVARTNLVAKAEPKGYYVIADIPRLSDVKTQVLRSMLVVNLPARNQVKCSNAHGSIKVTDLSGGLVVDAENCRIEVSNVTGGVELANSTGPITVNEGAGRLGVTNSYAQVEITGWEGELEIENAYAPVRLADNRGPANISNSGEIRISAHRGDVEIENHYGIVDVMELEGNLTVVNAYADLVVKETRGSVDAENAFGRIDLSAISGPLTVVNHSGSIALEDVGGPIDVTNQGGAIDLVVTEGLSGGSAISTDGGSLNVKFLQQPDLVLMIHNVGGDITSNLPIRVTREGTYKSAELTLGDGRGTLDLSGTNSSIVVMGRY